MEISMYTPAAWTALRKHDTAIFSELWKKIHFNLTCCRYAIWMTDNLNFFFFFFTVQFYQTCRIPDETKKILGPKIKVHKVQTNKL